ncbi:MAG: serine/threonine protein kinase [Verrucomicrobia bacterium]|nr:serine/threonine protein kinase [Verrucomicrobiota bacterium]
MSVPLPPNEEELFSRAAELPAAERAAYLDQVCAGDAALRARIEALLRADEAARSFMESPPAADLAQAVTQNAPRVVEAAVGDRIGRYKLLQKLGEGGCGVVFMAEQEEPVRRRVALKVIKLGMDTKEVVARFEAERQALALMDHANIARVFDAGATDAGRPFFVMELVRGIPITKFCDEQNLPTARRLELFAQVCHAVQHAHQKGIIHRDLKPSNILVTLHDGVPVPKVIDFGIAKATQGRLTDATLFTAFEQFIGTPAYMSPEQAELSGLDIDTRSDIYSLGVLLYELLTGRPPFDPKSLVSAGLDEIRRIIREVEPPRPSTRLSTLTDADRSTVAKHRGTAPAQLSTLLRGDLDWIVMRCLEKDRTRRYETANGLALDVLRHLHDEPVVARPASRAYRLRKLVRRNRLAVGAVTAIAAALVVGLGFATWRYQREKTARAAEAAARALADQRRSEVESINRFLVSDMLGSANPEVAQGREITVKEVLNNAAARIPKAFEGNPLLEASVRATIGESYRGIGSNPAADPHLVSALATRQRLLGEEHSDTLASTRALGALRRAQGRYGESEKLLRRALEAQTRLFGASHEQTLTTANELTTTLYHALEREEFRRLAGPTYELALRTLGPDHRETLIALHSYASQVRNTHDREAADRLYTQLFEAQRRTLGPDHPDTLGTELNRAELFLLMGRLDEAEEVFRRGLKTTERLFGPESFLIPRFQRVLVQTLRRQNKTQEAEEIVAAVFDTARKAGGQRARNALSLVSDEWTRLTAETNFEAAATLMREWAELFPANSARLPRSACLDSLGMSLSLLGRNPEAETALREACEIRKAAIPKQFVRFVTQHRLGGVLVAQRKFGEAETLLVEGYEALKAGNPVGTRRPILETLDGLVRLYTDWERPAKAAEWRAKRDEDTQAFIKETLHWMVMKERGDDLRAARRFDELLALRSALLAAQTGEIGREHRTARITLEDLGTDYLAAGQPARAGECFRELLRLREKLLPDDWSRFDAMTLLGEALIEQTKFAEAGPLLVEARKGLFARAMKIPADRRTRLRAVLEAGIRLYEKWGKSVDAGEWKRERDAFELARAAK